MRLFLVITSLFLAGCVHTHPPLPMTGDSCALRFSELQKRYCALQKSNPDVHSPSPPGADNWGALTRDTADAVIECEQDQPDFDAGCDGR
jgi:hypothetical protein